MVDYLQKRKTINGTYYASFLRQLRDTIEVKGRGKLSKGVLFHKDNAPARTSVIAIATINDCGFELIQRPPYLPYLSLHQTSIDSQSW